MPPFHIHITTVASGKLSTFDNALIALSQLPRMFIEPDGSFVWPSAPGEVPVWQLDGNLVDGGESLYYVELKGDCPIDAYRRLRSCIVDEPTTLRLELCESGTFVGETEFLSKL